MQNAKYLDSVGGMSIDDHKWMDKPHADMRPQIGARGAHIRKLGQTIVESIELIEIS